MKSYILVAFLIFLPLSGNGSNDSPIKVNIIYDEPVSGYYVTGEFHPFDAESETGQIELRFTPVNGGRTLVLSNVGKHEAGHPDWPQKFTGKNIYDIVFYENFKGFKDGETLHWHYHSAQSSFWRESPLLYDAEFQFYDVDFDGQDEFLVNDYEKARYGNGYTVYEITSKGFVLKTGKPFDNITNLTEFYPEKHQIVNPLYDDTDDRYIYTISRDGNTVTRTVKLAN
jgi:hypothetical protein